MSCSRNSIKTSSKSSKIDLGTSTSGLKTRINKKRKGEKEGCKEDRCKKDGCKEEEVISLA
jgi:hypothetical protein